MEIKTINVIEIFKAFELFFVMMSPNDTMNDVNCGRGICPRANQV